MIRAISLCAVLIAACSESQPAGPSHLEVVRFDGTTSGVDLEIAATNAQGQPAPTAGYLEVALRYRDASGQATSGCRVTMGVEPADFQNGHLSRQHNWDGLCSLPEASDVWILITLRPTGGTELSARADAPAALRPTPPEPAPPPAVATAGVLSIPSLGIQVSVPDGSQAVVSPGDLEGAVAVDTGNPDCRPAIVALAPGDPASYETVRSNCLDCEFQLHERDGDRGWRSKLTSASMPGRITVTRGIVAGDRLYSCRATSATPAGADCVLAVCDSIRPL